MLLRVHVCLGCHLEWDGIMSSSWWEQIVSSTKKSTSVIVVLILAAFSVTLAKNSENEEPKEQDEPREQKQVW